MKIYKLLLITLMMTLLSTFTASEVTATEKTARTSARLTMPEEKVVDKREQILKSYLEKYDSPLAPHAGKFIAEADKNGLDWKLLVSIAGVESYFGQQIPYNSYNGWGWGVYNGNVHNFTSWDEGITEISYELKTRYMDQWGAKSVQEIGSFYAADPMWASKVTHFMTELEAFSGEENKTLITISL